MNLVHALVEIDTVVLLFSYTHIGSRSERVVLFFNLLNGGYFAEAKDVLVGAFFAKLRNKPFALTGYF